MKKLLLLVFLFSLTLQMLAQKDSIRIKNLFDKAYNLEVSKPDSAIVLYNNIIALSQKKYPIFVAKANNYKGIVYNDLGKYDSALVYYKKSISNFQKINNKKGIAANYINIGNTFKLKGEFPNAISNYFLGITIYEEIKDDFRLSISYANLATLYEDVGEYSNAKTYYSKSNVFSEKEEDSIQLVHNYYNLSNLYANEKKIDSSFTFIKSARNYLNKSKNSELNHLVNYGEARNFLDRNKRNAALLKAKEALRFSEKIKNPYYLSLNKHLISTIYLHQNKLQKAEEFALDAIKISEKHNNKLNSIKIYKQLTGIYKRKGDYKKALNYKDLEHQFQKEVLNEKQLKNIKVIDIKYQTEKKDKEIISQELELKQQQSKLQKKETQYNYMIGISLFLLISSILLWILYQQRQKRKNQEILTLKREFQIKTLESLIEGEEKERFRIAKELHDGVNGDLAAIKYKLSSLLEMNNSVIKETIAMIDDSCKQVRAISHNLVPPSLENFNLIEATETYCTTMDSVSSMSILFQYLGDDFFLLKKTEINIFRIIQELVTNSVKHSEATEINVQISNRNNLLNITVEDDGKGFDINNESKNGIGLLNIKSRADFLNAIVDVVSNKKGTSYTFEIDLTAINDN